MQDYLSLGYKGKNQWWRYVLGIFIVFLFFGFLGYIPTELYIDSGNYAGMSSAEIYEIQATDNFTAVGLSNNIGLMTLIAGFAMGLIALFVIHKMLHSKKILHLINASGSIRWKRIFTGFAIWGFLILAITIFDVLVYKEDFTLIFEWKKFLPLLFIALFLLPIQTSFEELFVRGYIMQGIQVVTKYPAIPIFVSSLIFPLMHLMNPEVEAFGWYIMLPYYFGFALMLAIITVMDKGLEIALGIHAANNIIAALTVTYDDAVIKTDSIWMQNTLDIDGWSLLIYFICFFLTLYAVYYLYHREEKEVEVS